MRAVLGFEYIKQQRDAHEPGYTKNQRNAKLLISYLKEKNI